MLAPARPPADVRPAALAEDPCGDMRRRILTLLQDSPEGLTPTEVRDRLGAGKSLVNTLGAMYRDGLVQRVGPMRTSVSPVESC